VHDGHRARAEAERREHARADALPLPLQLLPQADLRGVGCSDDPKSFWARAFYDQQRAKGAKHQVALRALAYKWIRILFRIWKDRVPCDETRYLKALKKRGSTLLKNLAQA